MKYIPEKRSRLHSSHGHGLATKAIAHPGKHEVRVQVLMNVSPAVFPVPGCISYVVGKVASEPGTVFISEFWDIRH